MRADSARAIVVATGSRTELGAITSRIGTGLPQTAFQNGLRAFVSLLDWITAVVTSIAFVVNAFVHHSVLESLLFAGFYLVLVEGTKRWFFRHNPLTAQGQA